MKKETGILLAISSLHGNYSIGSFGRPAKEFVDFLHENKFTWWQILPLCQTDNSPYSASSIFSISAYYIDLEIIFNEGLLTKEELDSQFELNNGKCNYSRLKKERLKTLYSAFRRFNELDRLQEFVNNNSYVREFCEYEALCFVNNNRDWRCWHKFEIPHEVLNFHYFLQYQAYEQFFELKKYAGQKGIKIMGDLPLYTSLCGSEVYFHRKDYQLGDNYNPVLLSGARPDGFSATGQCWGHPLYAWDTIATNYFAHWKDKLIHMCNLFDGIRLDHFRGFESYWAVSSATRNAAKGQFLPGPGRKLFDSVKDHISSKLMVGEDLGKTTVPVQTLIDELGFYNMRVIQYGLDENNEEDLPTNYTENCVAYTGTHDNHTLISYLENLSSKDKLRLSNSLPCRNREDLYTCVVRSMYESKAQYLIFPIQDILRLDDKYVLNTHMPNEDNWRFRITKDMLNNPNAAIFKSLNEGEKRD